MTVGELKNTLGLKIVAGEAGLSRNVKGGYTGDLLSFVIGHAKEEDVWVTVQGHMNTLAVAVMVGISAVILAEGVEIDEAVKIRANAEQIPVLVSERDSFTLSHEIAKLL